MKDMDLSLSLYSFYAADPFIFLNMFSCLPCLLYLFQFNIWHFWLLPLGSMFLYILWHSELGYIHLFTCSFLYNAIGLSIQLSRHRDCLSSVRSWVWFPAKRGGESNGIPLSLSILKESFSWHINPEWKLFAFKAWSISLRLLWPQILYKKSAGILMGLTLYTFFTFLWSLWKLCLFLTFGFSTNICHREPLFSS